MLITGRENIEHARLITLKHMLHLEMKGLKRRGRSAYAIIKSELGFRGNRQRVYDQLVQHIQQKENERAELSDN